MALVEVGREYWWAPLATDALTRAGAAASPLPAGAKWTDKHGKATRAFQKMARLSQDGDVGPNTVRELRAVVGPLPVTDKQAAQAFAEVLVEASKALLWTAVAKASGSEWATKFAGELLELVNDFGNAWDDAVPQATRSLFVSKMSDEQKAAWRKVWLDGATADAGAVPVLAAPFILMAGAEVTAAGAIAAAEATVVAVGAGVALASAAWLAERLNAWVVKAAPTAPESVTADGTAKVAPPAHLARVGSPPPPQIGFSLRDFNVRQALKRIGRWLVLTLAWLVGGIGAVASLFGPLVTAAAGAAGALFWLLLAAAAAFLAARRRKGGG